MSCIASNNNEHACGSYNRSNVGTRFSIGIGTGNSTRANAFEVNSDGKVYVKGVGNYTGTTTSGKADLASVIEGALDGGASVAKIKAAAAEASTALEGVNDVEGIKSVLTIFFNTIK